MTDKHSLVFLGYNNMFTHKRGVENVIHFQSQVSPFAVNYYLHWDSATHVYRFENLICIGVKKNLLWFISLNVLLFKIKKKKKLFIHSHNPLMSIMSMYNSNLFTVHDALYYLTGGTKHRLNKVFWLLEKILYLRTDFVHFISNYAKKMSLFSGNKNFIIIPNTSHLENYKMNNKMSQSIENKKFKIAATKVFIVRSIEERARIDLIIKVAVFLKEENYEFIVAGKGPLLIFYREEIKKLNLKNITLLGYVHDDELVNYYNECDIVLVPAEYGEGFGLPIIEGYLFNKPVIASNRCAIPEVIYSKDFIFENKVESIIEKLEFTKKYLKPSFKDYYDEKFSNAIVFKSMNQLYNKLS